MVPRKNAARITNEQLLEPFRSYWLGLVPDHQPLTRHWQFYLVDGELYVQEQMGAPLIHWTQTSCDGVSCFRHAHNIERSNLPIVSENGEYLFALHYGENGFHATTADGKDFIIFND